MCIFTFKMNHLVVGNGVGGICRVGWKQCHFNYFNFEMQVIFYQKMNRRLFGFLKNSVIRIDFKDFAHQQRHDP